MATHQIAPPSGDLLLGWTDPAVKDYIESKPLAAGDMMVVVSQYGGLRSYVLVRVENPALGAQKRVLVSQHQGLGGSTFYRTGKNCFQPKGQTRLIPPTECLAPYLKEVGDRVDLAGFYGIGGTAR